MKVLNLQPIPAGPGSWHFRLTTSGGRAIAAYLDTGESVTPPSVLDGLAMAAMPMAMQRGFDLLRIHGPITHGALWRLLEYARIWHLWSPEQFHPTRIEPNQVVHGTTAGPAGPALVAWSGDLLSSHTLIRMLEQRAAGAPAIGGVMQLSGIRRGDEAGIDNSRRIIEDMGLRFHHVRTNALQAGLIDTQQGRLPQVAAAMHLLSEHYSCGIHARGYPLAAQTIYPRPSPALPDLFSGDSFAVRADGGCNPLPQAAAALLRYPELANAAQSARRHIPHARQTLLRLAFRAAGASGPADGWRDALDAFLLPVGDSIMFCDAQGICNHWMGNDRTIRNVLKVRLRLGQLSSTVRDYTHWLLSMAHLRRVYPR